MAIAKIPLSLGMATKLLQVSFPLFYTFFQLFFFLNQFLLNGTVFFFWFLFPFFFFFFFFFFNQQSQVLESCIDDKFPPSPTKSTKIFEAEDTDQLDFGEVHFFFLVLSLKFRTGELYGALKKQHFRPFAEALQRCNTT